MNMDVQIHLCNLAALEYSPKFDLTNWLTQVYISFCIMGWHNSAARVYDQLI